MKRVEESIHPYSMTRSSYDINNDGSSGEDASSGQDGMIVYNSTSLMNPNSLTPYRIGTIVYNLTKLVWIILHIGNGPLKII